MFFFVNVGHAVNFMIDAIHNISRSSIGEINLSGNLISPATGATGVTGVEPGPLGHGLILMIISIYV